MYVCVYVYVCVCIYITYSKTTKTKTKKKEPETAWQKMRIKSSWKVKQLTKSVWSVNPPPYPEITGPRKNTREFFSEEMKLRDLRVFSMKIPHLKLCQATTHHNLIKVCNRWDKHKSPEESNSEVKEILNNFSKQNNKNTKPYPKISEKLLNPHCQAEEANCMLSRKEF